MTATDSLHKLISDMLSEDDSETITRQDLRDAAEMLGIFPEHRFRWAFADSLTRLENSGAIEREGEEIHLLTEYGDSRPARARHAPDNPYGERTPPHLVPAACDRLLELMAKAAPDNAPIDAYRFNPQRNPDPATQMSMMDISAALQDLRRRGVIEWVGHDVRRVTF